MRKSQDNEETVAALVFVETAYDIMQLKEELLIRVPLMEIGGKVVNWVMDFLNKVGSEMSIKYKAENRTPWGSVISHIVFSIMNYYTIGKSLFCS